MEKNIEKTLNSFKIYLHNLGYSDSTLSNYIFCLKDFLAYLLENSKNIDNFNNDDLQSFRSSLISRYKNGTINSKIFAVKKYSDYLKSIGHQVDLLDLHVLKTKGRKDLLPVNNFNKLLAHIDEVAKNDVIRDRDKLLLSLLYYTGIKTRIILTLRPRNLRDGSIFLDDKFIGLPNGFCNKLDEYIDKIKLSPDQFLFFSNASQRINFNAKLTEKSVQDLFNKYKVILGNNYSIRDLRHSYLFKLKNKTPRFIINKIYSHKTLSISNEYFDKLFI